ncbi:hypothetical protein SNOG_06506 [Parastagonospora nodorum SN15]|uniref:Amidase domain-containing protein n=1 Tax=Phaeosphaeria nodorum (strain SN15 / ATCC MYA-4574 / FGSC 10173) TaxID=321614 RepID=Q0UP08_PHANO|nr:hypothetical protein SNOG_06506 [Parastagonospora nodorum SN15]EAT86337.2 hypothetical protein SNOG_06506 [Parastagonospora nodorum SN15]
MGFLQALSVASIALASSVQAAVSSTGFTVSLNDVNYFLPGKPTASISGCEELQALFKDGPFVPFTVVKNGSIDAAAYSEDDVWQPAFLEGMLRPLQRSSDDSILTRTQLFTLKEVHQSTLRPYFINAAGEVYEAWRLFSDVQGAFLESAISNGDGTFSVLPAGTVGQKQAIAVPSRLYYTKTAEKPLAGVRIGIKDIYDIKGLRTSNGNRAWYWFYPPANNTAPPVQNLIDAGAIIVGKMLTSQFANGEQATADWVDYHEAFNPRGDGYQDTSSSSSGGGAGTAAYHWLDVSLGSDTGGSLLTNFLGNVSEYLQANVSAYNLTSEFSNANPTIAPLETLMNLTYAILITKQQIELVRDPFYADYAAKYDGRRPFVNPVPLARWGWGANQTNTVEEAVNNKTIFMDWVNSGILTPSPKTCSESLVLYVGSTARADPRNVYFEEPGVPFGFSNSRISVMAEVPDFVVPIGEAPYNSTITGHVEYLPVTVDFLAAKGCDGMLFSLINDLHAKGIVKTALSGRSGITGGDILFKRGGMQY